MQLLLGGGHLGGQGTGCCCLGLSTTSLGLSGPVRMQRRASGLPGLGHSTPNAGRAMSSPALDSSQWVPTDRSATLETRASAVAGGPWRTGHCWWCSWGDSPDLLSEVDGVVSHPAQQRGAAGVLPGEAEHVQARRGCDASRLCMMRPCSSLTPGMSIHVLSAVKPVAHTTASNSDARAVGEGHCPPGRSRHTGPDPDAVVTGELSAARSRSPGPARTGARPSRESAVTSSSRSCRRPRPHVAAKGPLGNRRDPLADR